MFKVRVTSLENVGIKPGQTKDKVEWVGQWSLGIDLN